VAAMRAIADSLVVGSAESVTKTAMARRRPSGRTIRPMSLVAGVLAAWAADVPGEAKKKEKQKEREEKERV